jgi:serine/threonine protein kinase
MEIPSAQHLPPIPGFRLVRELGKGGSATVYLAENAKSERVALKVFHSSLEGNEETKRRMLREWKAQTSSDSGLVQIRDFLQSASHSVLVMDFVDGQTLLEFQRQLPYILPEISVLVILEVLKTLERVHEKGIIHRDIKPSNIMISRVGEVFLTDFGLAKWSDASSHTHHGSILGSPEFMSPEQAQGEVVDQKSDLYSLASVLYFLTTGTKAFHKGSPLATLAAVVKGDFEPPTLRNPKISPKLSRILTKALSVSTNERFASAKEFRETLEKYLEEIGFPTYLTLSSWIENPSQQTMSALHLLAETLTKNARASLAKSNFNETTLWISHLTLVAPDSLAAQEILENLSEARRPKRKFAALILVLLCGVFGGIFVYHRQTSVAPLTPPLVATPPLTSTTTAASVSASSTVENKIVSTAVSPPPSTNSSTANRVETATTVASAPTRPRVEKKVEPQLINFSLPENVEVEWNGISIPLNRPFYAKPGIHQVTFRKEGFQPIIRQIEVKPNEPTTIQVN